MDTLLAVKLVMTITCSKVTVAAALATLIRAGRVLANLASVLRVLYQVVLVLQPRVMQPACVKEKYHTALVLNCNGMVNTDTTVISAV